MDSLAVVFMLSVAIKALLDYIATVVRKSANNPELNLAWFDAIALVIGLAIAWFAPLNAFAQYISNVYVGVVLTGLLMGGGTALLNQVLGGVQGRSGSYVTTIIEPATDAALDADADTADEVAVEYMGRDVPLRGW